MFCKNCGQPMREESSFCPKCGTRMNVAQQLYSPPSFASSAPAAGKGKNKLIPVIIAVAAVIVIVAVTVAVMLITSGEKSSKTGKDAAEEYLTACHEEDVDAMLALVPDSVIKEITEQYGCSKKELKEAVSDEIGYWSDRLSNNNGRISGSHKTKRIDDDDYEDYFDRRVENCIDYDKISAIDIYRVELKNDYYYEIPVYKYKGEWYAVDAATFVAYAVWERY